VQAASAPLPLVLQPVAWEELFVRATAVPSNVMVTLDLAVKPWPVTVTEAPEMSVPGLREATADDVGPVVVVVTGDLGVKAGRTT